MSSNETYSLTQLVLPYENPETGDKKGLQFGLPIDKGSREVKVLNAVRCSVLVLNSKNETKLIKNVVYKPPVDNKPDPPIPVWGWVSFDISKEGKDTTAYARLTAPSISKGSEPFENVPLARKEDPKVYTPYGLDFYATDGIKPKPFDCQVNFTLDNTKFTGEVPLILNDTLKVADVAFVDGHLTYVKPGDFFYENSLWTSHLYRLLYLYLPNLEDYANDGANYS